MHDYCTCLSAMLTGECTCDGSGFGGLTRDEIIIEGGNMGCLYCNMDTGGNHQYDCPLYSIPSYIISKEGNLMKEEKEVDLDKEQIEKLKEELEKARIEKESREKYPNPYKYYPSTYGWVCPVCGKGNAPWQGTCPCKNSWTVTWE